MEVFMSLTEREYIQINQALFSLAHAYEARMQREEAENPSGLALSDRAVLMVLGQFGPLNSRQLSRLMDINPGTISVYVQRLVEKGMIERSRDQQDRRNWWLHLTEAGLAAYQETITGTVIYTRDFLSALDGSEQRSLHALLTKAAHSLGFSWQKG
jgi:DNA-binding MarR family transcriptional regulator